MGDLPPTDEHNGSHVVIVVIHQDCMALQITDVIFETLSRLHLSREEVIDVILKFLSESVLLIEDLPASPLQNSKVSSLGEDRTNHRRRL